MRDNRLQSIKCVACRVFVCSIYIKRKVQLNHQLCFSHVKRKFIHFFLQHLCHMFYSCSFVRYMHVLCRRHTNAKVKVGV